MTPHANRNSAANIFARVNVSTTGATPTPTMINPTRTWKNAHGSQTLRLARNRLETGSRNMSSSCPPKVVLHRE
jgi:hypothetical protein